MSRLRLMIGESLRSLTANLSTTVAATMTVLIGMFLLGLAIVLTSAVGSLSDKAQEQLLVKAYFCTPDTCARKAEAGQINALRVRLLGMPEVAEVKFISKQEAYKIMKKRSPDLVDNLVSNPFPDAFEIKAERAEFVPTIGQRLERRLPAGVHKVNWAEKSTRAILYFARAVWVGSIIAVVLLAAAAALLIGNTIRLSIFSRRREIEVMKLVGATNWFVRGPFMIEGLLCGLFGSFAAVVLLLLGKELLQSTILADRDWGVDALPFIWNAVILVGVGLALGAVGSGLTLRRFLRV